MNVPHPKLAAHLLGHGRHAYMHLCISPGTMGPMGRVPDTLEVASTASLPRTTGAILDRLNRLGMTQRLGSCLANTINTDQGLPRSH